MGYSRKWYENMNILCWLLLSAATLTRNPSKQTYYIRLNSAKSLVPNLRGGVSWGFGGTLAFWGWIWRRFCPPQAGNLAGFGHQNQWKPRFQKGFRTSNLKKFPAGSSSAKNIRQISGFYRMHCSAIWMLDEALCQEDRLNAVFTIRWKRSNFSLRLLLPLKVVVWILNTIAKKS